MKESENLPVEEAREVRKRNRLFWQNVFNPIAYKKLDKNITKLEKSIENAEPEDRLEEIILDNMKNFAKGSRDLAKYLSQKKGITTKETINSIYGDKTFERLKQELSNYDWQADYKSKELELERKKVDPRRYEEKLQKTLKTLAEKIENYGREKQLVPKDLELNIVPIPASRKQRAFYNAEQKEVNIGLDYFNVVKENKELRIDATEVIYSIFHEFIGHATHHHNSAKLKHPQFTERPAEDTMSTAHAEAVGIKANKHAQKFLKQKQENLPVTEIGIQIKKSKMKAKGQTGKIAAILYNEMERRNEIESAEQKLSKLVSKEWAKRAAKNWDTGVKNAIKETSYIAAEKILEETNTQNHQALTTGLWNPKTLPKYLKHRKQN
jgi:hypothetical protein